jgi:ribonuclease P protein component
MLKKSKRLRSSEVAAVLKAGRSARSTHLQVKLLVTSEPLRSAAVVAKSVARKATVRNNLRRALYRALAAINTSNVKGQAIFFVRAVPVHKKPAAIFAEELPALLVGLVSKLK